MRLYNYTSKVPKHKLYNMKNTFLRGLYKGNLAEELQNFDGNTLVPSTLKKSFLEQNSIYARVSFDKEQKLAAGIYINGRKFYL